MATARRTYLSRPEKRARKAVNSERDREHSEFYRVMGGVRVLHNGLGFNARPRKVEHLPLRFNSGPTPRDAIFDLVRLVEAHPEVWERL